MPGEVHITFYSTWMVFRKCWGTFKAPGCPISNKIIFKLCLFPFFYKSTLAYKIILFIWYTCLSTWILWAFFSEEVLYFISPSVKMSHYVFLFLYLLLSVSVDCEYLGWLYFLSYGGITVNNVNENIQCINITNLGSKWWDTRKRNTWYNWSKWDANGTAGAGI